MHKLYLFDESSVRDELLSSETVKSNFISLKDCSELVENISELLSFVKKSVKEHEVEILFVAMSDYTSPYIDLILQEKINCEVAFVAHDRNHPLRKFSDILTLSVRECLEELSPLNQQSQEDSELELIDEPDVEEEKNE